MSGYNLLRKSTCISLLVLAVTIRLYGQAGMWTWMNGSSSPNPSPNFGTQGVPAATNQPRAVFEPVEWTDLNGDFWLFGGVMYQNSSVPHETSALWKYDISLGMWIWMNGPSAIQLPGVYGTQGVPSPLNTPGARGWGTISWIDLNGNLWLFGGFGYDASWSLGLLNDLWMYSIATNEWTWMSGSNAINSTGNFGILQLASSVNQPPSGDKTAAGWVDNSGNLWMFGGRSFDPASGFASGQFMTDDMWMFNISTNQWTWMSGQQAGPVSPNHGILGVPSPTNTPGGRYVYAHWKDKQGRFWMHGGFSATVFSAMDDMWMYDPTTLLWTWMAGGSIPYSLTPLDQQQQCIMGNYTANPCGENRACWTDKCGRFWCYGGFDYLTADYDVLWVFDPVTLEFSWTDGTWIPASPGSFGAQNIPSATNIPPTLYGANPFTSFNGDLWLFGGVSATPSVSSYTLYNALWRYQIDPNCPTGLITANFAPVQDTGCTAFSPQLFSLDTSTVNYYHWDFGDGTILSDTSNQLVPNWSYTQPGTYTVTLIVSNPNSCNTADTTTQTITVYQQPSINLGNDTFFCSLPGGFHLDAGNTTTNYLWSTGDTTATINPINTGIYSVIASSEPNGFCQDRDTITLTIASQPSLGNDTSICSNQTLTLDPGISGTYLWSTGDTTATITVNTSGLYSVQVSNAPCILTSSINLNVNPTPIIDLGSDTLLCPGAILSLDAQNLGSIYQWNTGATTQTISADSPDTYSVAVTSIHNCINFDSIVIAYAQDIDLGTNQSLCDLSGEIILDAGNPEASYFWNTGDTTQTITVNSAGVYWVVMNNGLCIVGDTIELTGEIGGSSIYIPNAFTPDQNGLNEKFQPAGTNIIDFSMAIYNRWGELVYETNDINMGWDGKRNGNLVQQDVYVYSISYTSDCLGSKQVYKSGHVVLIR